MKVVDIVSVFLHLHVCLCSIEALETVVFCARNVVRTFRFQRGGDLEFRSCGLRVRV